MMKNQQTQQYKNQLLKKIKDVQIQEEIKELEEYTGYFISNIGRVFYYDEQDRQANCPQHINQQGSLEAVNNDIYLPSVHRYVARYFIYNDLENQKVFHINGDKLDSNYLNLKIPSIINQEKKQKKKLDQQEYKYRGIVIQKKGKKYRAQIGFNNKKIHLGCYDCIVETAKAYNKKAVELLGENAKLNIINEDDCTCEQNQEIPIQQISQQPILQINYYNIQQINYQPVQQNNYESYDLLSLNEDN